MQLSSETTSVIALIPTISTNLKIYLSLLTLCSHLKVPTEPFEHRYSNGQYLSQLNFIGNLRFLIMLQSKVYWTPTFHFEKVI